MWRRSSLEAAALALLPALGAAQALPPVTITATRTEANPFDVPASVTVIDGDAARAAGRAEANLSETIAAVPGVAARERQNYAQDLQLSIRGFGTRSTFGVRGVRIYVDGIPATMPDGQGQLSHVDLATAGRIEVLRGPFSALYGNSSGGVVQVETERGEGAPRVTANAIAGSYGLSHPGLRVSGSAGRMGYVVSANRLELDGYRDHSAVTRDVANARLDFRPTYGRTWTLVANTLSLRADDPLGLSRAQFEAAPRSVDPAAIAFDTRKTVRQQQAGLVHEARLSAADRVRLMAYSGTRDTEQFQSIPPGPQANPLHPGGVIGLGREYMGTDLRWTHKAHAWEIVGGLSYDRMSEHRRGWQNFVGSMLGVQGAPRRDEDNTVSNVDPYLQGVWKPAPRWSFTAGVRHSTVRFDSRDHYVAGTNGDDSGAARYSATSPVAAAMFAVSPDLHAYASFGRGFETPTFNELAYRPGGVPGLNFALKPARSRNVETGLKGRVPGRIEWNAALFHTRTTDEIVVLTNTGGRSTFANAGSTRRRGAEVDALAFLGRDWQVQVAQTWLDARYDSTGNRLPGTAASFTALELAWKPAQGWWAGAELRRSSRVWVNDANSEAAPSFTAVALDAGYAKSFERWTLAASARVDNVFDRRYAGSVIVNEGNGRYYEPAPGRNWTFKATARYAF